MSDEFTLVAESRADAGKGASRRLRRDGKVPAILYGGDAEPRALTLSHNEVVKRLRHDGFYSHLLNIEVDGNPEQAILRDLQRHPYKPIILHMDFQRVVADHEIHVNVPLHFINEDKCVGVKTGGGAISHQMMEVEIECLPKDLPEFIDVDMAGVNVGEAVMLSQLQLPPGVVILDLAHDEDYDAIVASVHLIREIEEVEPAEEAPEAEAAEEEPEEPEAD